MAAAGTNAGGEYGAGSAESETLGWKWWEAMRKECDENVIRWWDGGLAGQKEGCVENLHACEVLKASGRVA